MDYPSFLLGMTTGGFLVFTVRQIWNYGTAEENLRVACENARNARINEANAIDNMAMAAMLEERDRRRLSEVL
jgi:hypothetical protein